MFLLKTVLDSISRTDGFYEPISEENQEIITKFGRSIVKNLTNDLNYEMIAVSIMNLLSVGQYYCISFMSFVFGNWF